ncbi:unnamed protein product [Paramecium sonneborni]|uniref:Uncharacterized protein n=1 Tax=Paramecium sonneborni TaxID=65129 RepID=A0A8S1RE79_9CILI|nr:unnamed protein product [Paramecium sonneborni]
MEINRRTNSNQIIQFNKLPFQIFYNLINISIKLTNIKLKDQEWCNAVYLKDNINNIMIVNLGWIPQNYLDKIGFLERIQLNDMSSVIKLPEHPDQNKEQYLMNTFIDLQLIAKENQLNQKIYQIIFRKIIRHFQ